MTDDRTGDQTDDQAAATPPKVTSTLGWIRRGAVSNLALPLTALLTSPILARALGADGRGALAATTIFFLLAANTLTFGLPETLTLHVARRQVTSRQAVRLAVWTPMTVGLATAVVAFFVVPVVLRQYPQYVWLGRSVFLLLPVALSVQALRGAVLGLSLYRPVNRERYVSVTLRLGLLLVLLVVGGLDVTSAALITLVTGALSGAVLLVAFLRARPRFSPTEVTPTRTVRRYGLKIWFGSIAQFLTYRFDQVILAGLVPAASLGAYAVAVSLAEVSNNATIAVRDVLFARASGVDDPALIPRGCRLAVALSTSILVVGGLSSQLLLVPIFGPDFEPAIRLTQVLLVASVGSGVGAVVGAGLAVQGRPGWWSTAQLVGLLVTVSLIVPVVHADGGLGAAYLSVASYWATSLLGILALSRRAGVPPLAYLVPNRADLALAADLIARRRGRDTP